MKRLLIAASVVATAFALGSPSVKAEGKMYANPEFVTGFSGSKSSGSSLDLHVGYKDGPFFIQAGPAMSNDTTSTCLLYTSPSPRDATLSRMPSSA